MIVRLVSELFEILGIRESLRELMHAIVMYDVPRITPIILRTLPHDPEAFTQGLAYHDGHLYESTGLLGRSSLRQLRATDGRIQRVVHTDPNFFAEGIARMDRCLYQLTWKSQQAIIYDVESLQELSRVAYRGEGWGLTAGVNALIMSDGSSRLKFCNEALEVLRTLRVTSHCIPVRHLNDLEWAEGKILANVLNSTDVFEIDELGRLRRIIDCSILASFEPVREPDHVLNGIAYNNVDRTFFMTGKCWKHIFEVKIPS